MKIVIVGFGGMGNAHLDNYIPRSNFDIKGIYDISVTVQNKAKEKGLYCYKSLDEVASDSEIDLVLIATPNDTHHPIAIKMMENKKAVLCEKPAALNVKELEEMIMCSKKNNVTFAVNQNRRYDRDFLTAKKIIESNEIGKVFHFESKVYGSRGIPGDWRGEKKHGGGMLLDWGIHLIDQFTMLNDFELDSIYAEFTNITNDDVDDGFRVHFRFKNGATALAEVATCNFIEFPRWYICGTNGTATLGQFKNPWDELGEKISIISNEKIDIKPIKAANGFTKTMAPRDDNSEVLKEKVNFEQGDPIEIYTSMYNAIRSKSIETVIDHESLKFTFNLIEDIIESAEQNKVIKYN
ncbi:MAG: Gfo/Idh/MocA family protein [Anaerocolumna sp.]